MRIPGRAAPARRALRPPARPRDPAGGEDDRRSRRLAVHVNVEKLLLLAALTPAVVGGIAQRAAEVSGPAGADATVASTVAVGAVGATVGAAALGRLSDIGRVSPLRRWAWVLCAALLGTAGLLAFVFGPGLASIVCGWGVAQLGYSGGMAVLRAMLAGALPRHRRRGSIVLVLSGYVGVFIPIVLLLVFPGGVWAVTFGLAALCVAAPAVLLMSGRPRSEEPAPGRPRGEGDDRGAGAGAGDALEARPAPASGAPAGAQARATPPSSRPAASMPAWAILVVQLANSAVTAAFLTYHPADIEQRLAGSDAPLIRSSALVLAAALIGLLAAGALLLRWHRLLAAGPAVVAAAGALFSLSIALRGLVETLPLVALAGLLSGAAVGLGHSALLALAVESASPERAGRRMGAFSACGALGQFAGPLGALAILTAVQSAAAGVDLFGLAGSGGYSALFVVIACVPLCWALPLGVGAIRGGRRARLRGAEVGAATAAAATVPGRRRAWRAGGRRR